MSRPQIISDKNKKSLNIKNLLIKVINKEKFEQDDLVIVVGGDGFMLETLKKNKNTKKKINYVSINTHRKVLFKKYSKTNQEKQIHTILTQVDKFFKS